MGLLQDKKNIFFHGYLSHVFKRFDDEKKSKKIVLYLVPFTGVKKNVITTGNETVTKRRQGEKQTGDSGCSTRSDNQNSK